MLRPLRRTTTAGILAGLTLGVVGIAASPASAAWTPPSQAPLTNAAGQTNGCTGDARLTVGRAAAGQPLALIATVGADCPASAGVGRTVFSLGLSEVMKDGSLRTVAAPGTIASSEGPLVGRTWATAYFPCSSVNGKGTHTWLMTATAKTKTSVTDTNPYRAKVGARVTLTCR